jgi:hypothetical protein
LFARDAVRLRRFVPMLILPLCACAPGDPGQIDQSALIERPAPGNPRDIVPATVPFTLDAQRVLLEVAFETPGGGARKALVWFNMGMPAPVLSKTLYRELGIDRGQPLRLSIGEDAIEVASAAVIDGDGGVGAPDFVHLFAPRRVEAMLPAAILQHYAVTLDYQRRTFTLAPPGARETGGVAAPCAVNPKTGLVTVEAAVAGSVYPVVIDAGSGYSWLRGDVVAKWLAAHPEWRRATGAVGQSNANMIDLAFEKEGVVVRAPEVSIGAVVLKNVGLLGTGPIPARFPDSQLGDFFWDNWGKGAAGPVIGWLGGNVLKDFRLTIDYPNQMTYWRRETDADAHDLDQVGLTLVRRSDRYFVGAIVRKASPGGADDHAVDGVEIGDELVAVGDLNVLGAPKDAVLAALHGKPGDRRRLVLEHGGARREIDAAVTAFD